MCIFFSFLSSTDPAKSVVPWCLCGTCECIHMCDMTVPLSCDMTAPLAEVVFAFVEQYYPRDVNGFHSVFICVTHALIDM